MATRETRLAALVEAEASLRLAGLELSPANFDLFTAWVEGQLSGGAVRKKLIDRALVLQASRKRLE